MSTPDTITGLTLDTGALLALDDSGKSRRMQTLLDRARQRGGEICIPAGAVAQAWRSPRQVRLARVLGSSDTNVAVMTLAVARAVGLLCAATGHDDVVDVHVTFCARQRHHAIITSDPGDIARIDPTVPWIRI